MSEKWQLTVYSTTTGDEIELEVSPTTLLEDVFNLVASTLNLNLEDPDMRYVLVSPGHAKEYGPAHFKKTLAELGLRDGDRLQLIVRTPGGTLGVTLC